MAAVTQIDFYTGASPTADPDVSNVRYKTADNNSDDLNSPIQLPVEVGTYAYSWVKNSKINITTSPSGSISNLRFYVSGSMPTGIKLYAKTSSSYTQGTSNDETNLLSGAVDASTYTSVAPLTINAGTVITNPSTGVGSQDYLQTQLRVANTAAHGILTPITCVYEFDEI